MRLFIAVPIEDRWHPELIRLEDALRARLVSLGAAVKWTARGQWHMTLQFLGQRPEESLPALGARMTKALKGFASFAITWDGLGSFPVRGAEGSFWLGVQEGATELTEAAARIQEALVPLGIERDRRPFRPHVTLGRVKKVRDRRLLRKTIDECPTHPIGPQRVSSIDLFRSELTSTGPVYTRLDTFHF